MRGYNSHARRKYVDETYFEKIDTEDKAYWLGFIQADGCIYQQETTYRFQINLSGKDYEHLIKLNDCLSSTYSVGKREVIVKGKTYEACSLKINSKPFCEHLMKNGITIRKTLNDAFSELEESLMPHYIRGFLDGDGNIKIDRRSKNPRITVRFAGGEGFMIKLRNYLIGCGFQFSPKSIRRVGNSKAFELSFTGRENTKNFFEYVYCGNIYLERKHKLYLDALNEFV